MTSRREVLVGLAAGTVAVAGSAASAAIVPAAPRECARPAAGRYAQYLPNVVVRDHEGARALFYDDLVRGKTLLLHFFTSRDEASLALLRNVGEVYRRLGESAGREVFFYSIAADPEHDGPRVLREMAERHGVGLGWRLLTGAPADLELLRARLYAHNGAHSHAHGEVLEDCSRGLVRYGNEALGLWGAVPGCTDPAWIVERLSWLVPRGATSGPSRRRGPNPRTASMPWLNPKTEQEA